MKPKKMSGEVYIDVTEEQYQAMQAEGIDEDALLEPGRHKFVRGLFKKMHPDYDPKQAKVRISIYLDADVLAWFRARASEPNVAPYQTQINNELRALMEREALTKASGKPVGKAASKASSKASRKAGSRQAQSVADYSALLDDPHFIAAVAERVRRQPPSRKHGRRTA